MTTHQQIDNGTLITGPITVAGEYLYIYRQPDPLDRGSYLLADLRRLIAQTLLGDDHGPAQEVVLHVHGLLETCALELGVAIDAMAAAAKKTLPYPVQLEVTAVPDGSVTLAGNLAAVLQSDLPMSGRQLEGIRALLIGQSVDLGGEGTPRYKVQRVAHARRREDCYCAGLATKDVDAIELRKWASMWSGANLPENHVPPEATEHMPDHPQEQDMDPSQFISTVDGDGVIEVHLGSPK
jgi:hypothetical protein